jgi:DNA-binding MarR family transcriptional regulator
MNELSKQMGLAKSTMTRVVDNMVREGWIERAKICGDNRRVSVRLTRKGKGLAEKLEASSQGAVQDIFKYIPPGRLPRVVGSMKWVVRAMEKGVQKNGR